MRSLDFFNLPNRSSHTMAMGSTQPLTEMSSRNLAGGKELPALKADNITAICEPRRLTPYGHRQPVTVIELPFYFVC
jgi:hypothetical protein